MITARGTPRKLNLVLDNIDDKKIDFTNSFKLPCRCNMHQTNNSYLIKGEKRRQLMAELAAPSFNLHEIDVSILFAMGDVLILCSPLIAVGFLFRQVLVFTNQQIELIAKRATWSKSSKSTELSASF